jgi:hypothetical protein
MLKKINLFALFRISTVGAMRLASWKRRKHNRIQDQTQNWLFGKEYFYSSRAQEKRTDEKELKRRENQDLARHEYSEFIKEYLARYRDLTTYIKQFFPNYSAVKHDRFNLEHTIKRLFDYHLVEKDIAHDFPGYESHDYSIKISPENYWKSIIYHGVTQANFHDLINNELVRGIAKPIAEYYKLRDALTGWYIRKIIKCRDWITDTTQVFYTHFKFRDIPKEELCDKIRADFREKQVHYSEMFKVFGITEILIEKAIKATLNDAGRKKNFNEWYEANKHKWRVSFSFQQPKDYHLELLGLTGDPTKGEIKKAYRKKSLEVHPDIVGGDGKEFIELTKSYHYLIGTK